MQVVIIKSVDAILDSDPDNIVKVVTPEFYEAHKEEFEDEEIYACETYDVVDQ